MSSPQYFQIKCRWIPQSKIYETKKGTRFCLGLFPNGSRALLFPFYHECKLDRNGKPLVIDWYAPKEETIYDMKDFVDQINKRFGVKL